MLRRPGVVRQEGRRGNGVRSDSAHAQRAHADGPDRASLAGEMLNLRRGRERAEGDRAVAELTPRKPNNQDERVALKRSTA